MNTKLRRYRIAIIGLGIVGTALIDAVQKGRFAQNVEIARVLVRNLSKTREVVDSSGQKSPLIFDRKKITDKLDDILNDASIKIVVDCSNLDEPALAQEL